MWRSRKNFIMHAARRVHRYLREILEIPFVLIIGCICLLFVNIPYFWTISALVTIASDFFIFCVRTKLSFNSALNRVCENLLLTNMKGSIIRFIRMTFVIGIIFIFSPMSVWEDYIPIGWIAGFFILDPTLRLILRKKLPSILKDTSAD